MPWLDPRLRAHVDALRGPDGLADADARAGRVCRGRSPTAGSTSRPAAPTCTRPSTPTAVPADRRGDFEDVYGDWGVLREQVSRDGAVRSRLSTRTSPPRCGRPSANPSGLSTDHALALMTAPEGPALEAVCALADDLRRDAVGDEVTYVVNRNINFTNVCYTGCRFCAFAQRKTDADAYTLSLDEIAARARSRPSTSGRPRSACRAASTRSCPARPTSTSPAAVKQAAPSLHVHAFSPMEVMNGVARTGLSIARVPDRRQGGRRRLAARHRRRDPRRRRPLDPDQGQAADRASGSRSSPPRTASACRRRRR